MVKIMTARYAGTCATCTGAIKPGDKINYGGRGAVTHQDCQPAVRLRNHAGSRVYRDRSVRTRGRCEDAPCCGCCW